jgi:hypothetical protein
MCYSARIEHDYRKYQREYGADISLAEFAKLFVERADGDKVKLSKALDDAFASVTDYGIAEAIATWKRDQMAALEQEVFKQRKRLADAERKLATQPTKKASEEQRIATGKVEASLRRLGDLKRDRWDPQTAASARACTRPCWSATAVDGCCAPCATSAAQRASRPGTIASTLAPTTRDGATLRGSGRVCSESGMPSWWRMCSSKTCPGRRGSTRSWLSPRALGNPRLSLASGQGGQGMARSCCLSRP